MQSNGSAKSALPIASAGLEDVHEHISRHAFATRCGKTE